MTRRGLFFFWDSQGIPIDIALLHLRVASKVTAADEFVLLCEFMCDASNAGWKHEKIYSDLREANQCGGLNLPTWMMGKAGA